MSRTLRGWSVLLDHHPDPYKGSEFGRKYLGGDVFGHPSPRFPDGCGITTGHIASVEGRTVTTTSGSVYVLEGPPCPKYAQWCEDHGIDIDPENPIRSAP